MSENIEPTVETDQNQKQFRIEHLQPENNETVKRVYFTNVPYDISEDDFLDFLKDYEPISVLIPYQYVVTFGNKKTVQPLGVAYADFSTPEAANKVVVEVAGKQIPGKKQVLRVKLFEAYDPKKTKVSYQKEHRFISKFKSHYFKSASTKQNGEKVTDGENNIKDGVSSAENGNVCIEENEKSEGSDENEANKEEISEENKKGSKSFKTPFPTSKKWVYVTRLASDTLDSDLSSHFEEFSPNDIYLFKFKPKGKRNNIFNKTQLAAIIEFPTVEGIDDIASHVAEKMNGTKLKNVKISARPSFEKKVSEVINAAKTKEQGHESDEEKLLSSEANGSHEDKVSAEAEGL